MARLYTRKVWVNDQTKLSAKNLNHIEKGIEDVADAIDEIEAQGGAHTHPNKPTLDAITAAFTTELKTKYDAVENKSEVAVSAEGTSKDAVQYITIDGVEYKLAGSDIKYQELAGVSLDEITATGVYAITGALDTPANTANKGTLVVTKLTDTIIEQDWKSDVNSAQRLYTIGSSPVDNSFKVNGVTHEQGEVVLEPGAVYELEGNLVGKVTIGATTDIPTVRTKIILKGVNIQSDSDYAIGYLPDAEELVVVLAPDTKNYLVNSEVGEVADDDFGALHSANDLHIYGTGSLTVKNTKGHGIKGSDLTISGKPGICVEANHDAIHGGKLLKITGGTFVINGAKDAFSSSEHGSAQDGKMVILGGTFTINACKEAAFEGKSSYGIKKILDAHITLGAGVTNTFVSPNGFEIYETTTIVNNSGKSVPETTTLASKYGNPTITYLVNDEPVNVDEYDNTFTLSMGDPVSYRVSGNFSGKKIYILNNIKKVNIELYGVYCVDSINDPFIEYTFPDKSRVKVDCADGTLNYIRKANGYAVKSSKNINIVGKGDLIASSVYAPYGDLLIKGDGARILGTAYTNQLIVGADPEDIESSALDALGKYKAQIYINNLLVNTRKNNECGKVAANQYLVGSCTLGTVSDDYGVLENIIGFTGSRGEIAAVEGTVILGNFINKPEVFCLANSLTKTDILVYETAEAIHTEIPNIDDTSSSPWTVYSGDGYSKAAADEKFVAKSVYDALAAKVNATTPRTVEFEHEVVELTGKGKPKVIKYDADGIIKSIIISKYVCPEQVDDEPGNYLDDFLKEDRPVYARDGDFGYPEVDGTGQINFEPEFADGYEGYVLVPTVTPATGYNKFKTQWCTGVPNNYRFTKVNSDISVSLTPVLESAMPAHTVTYKIIAPNTYTLEDLLQVRRFRCKDQVEKYVTYITGENPKPYNTLDANICSGDVLVFEQDAEAPGEGLVGFTAIDKAYSDICGLPSADVTEGDACAYFNIEGETQGLDTWSVAVSKGKVKTNKLLGFVVEEVAQNITITITIASPVTVNYNDESVREVASGKVNYGFEMKNAAKELIYSESKAKGSDFIFTVVRGYEIAAVDGETPRDLQEAISELIDSITVNGVEQTVSDVITKVEATKKKDNFTFAGDFVTGNVVITLKAKPIH